MSAPIIVFPLYGQQQPDLSDEQWQAWQLEQRLLIKQHAHNEGLKAMFNMIERLAARMQAAAIDKESGQYEQGMAAGSGHVYQVLRLALESTEEPSQS